MTGEAGAGGDRGYLGAGGRTGIGAWIFSTDHKRVGVLYLASLLTFFLVALTIGVLMRVEQLTMGRTIMGPVTYNALFTLHGVIMVFLFVIPGLGAAFGNFMLPLMIGARDVAFPRLNLLSWWFYVLGAAIVITSLFTGGGPPDTGWTFYVPYSLRSSTNIPVAIFGAFVIGFSSILTGLNFITTIHRLRAPGMRFGNMPLFAWSLYATSWVQLLATPVLGITLLMVIMERVFGVPIFDPAKGGDPLLYQHLFWIYSHPAVYVMILPAMGAVTEIIPTFARRTVFGYRFIAFSSMAIAGVGSLVWAHHMFTSGLTDQAAMAFSLLTFLVAVPSAIKIFNWVSTLYKGSIQLSAALLYTLGFVFLFSIGGLTGLMQGALAVNVQVHDTYFIVGHFHYVIFGGTGFAFFGALHYWFPKMFGRMVDERRAKLAWIPIFVGFNLFYFTMLVIGFQGMPRRYFDHLPQFHAGHVLASLGAFLMVAGLLAMFHNLARALLHGAPAPANPWGGVTLEWSTPSPPPAENFAVLPAIPAKPYTFPREVAP